MGEGGCGSDPTALLLRLALDGCRGNQYREGERGGAV